MDDLGGGQGSSPYSPFVWESSGDWSPDHHSGKKEGIHM